MNIRAVLPPFLPIEDLRRSVASLLPDMEIVTEPTASGRYAPESVEVLVLTTFHSLPRELLERMPKLRFIQVASTGYDRVDIAACRERGIWVSNIPVANAKTVAEHVILLALAQLRNLPRLDQAMRAGSWPMLSGAGDLAGKVFGIVGMGRIGRELAVRLLPFETATVYYDIVRLPAEEERRLGVAFLPLPELLARAEIVSLHLPLTRETEGLLGEREFAAMRDDAILINTSRAEVIDMPALARQAGSGRLRIALDVFPLEPPDFSDPIFGAPKAIFTPHVAGVTAEAQQRFLMETVRNVLRYVQGKEPLYRVDGGPKPA